MSYTAIRNTVLSISGSHTFVHNVVFNNLFDIVSVAYRYNVDTGKRFQKYVYSSINTDIKQINKRGTDRETL